MKLLQQANKVSKDPRVAAAIGTAVTMYGLPYAVKGISWVSKKVVGIFVKEDEEGTKKKANG